MSDNFEERTYYVRTICMYMDLTKDTLLKLFKYLIKSDNITRFLTSGDTISKLFDLFKNDILNKTEYNLVCSCWPNPEKFDIALLIRLIIGLCKTAVAEPQFGWKNRPHPKDESLGADLIRLRDVRNKLIGHRADAKLSKAEYEKIWDKVEAILLRVIEKVEPESKNDFVTTLDGYKQYELDTEHTKVKRYLDQLIEYQHEIEKLQNKVEELSKKSQEFHVYFETTQGHYVQYIKLLFDGGHLVLCGVFERELKKCSQGLESLFCENREILQSRVDEEYQSYLFPLVPNQINHTSWDVDLLASVILLVFTDISEDDISNIEKIKHARLNYAEDALRCLDQDKFRDIWTDLIISLKDLSMNIDKEKKLQVESFIALYKKKSEGGDADEYLDQLRKRGVPVKTLKNIHSETVYQLRQLLRQLNERGIKFKTEHVLELKILTTCQNEEKKKHAEDFLEKHLEASLHGSDQPNKFIGIETNKFFASITTHPDVTPTGIKRGCIILSFGSSTPGGLLHLLDYFDSQHFNERLHNISNELHYLYEDAFLLQGYVTLESLSSTHTVGSEENNSENGLSLPLKCSSVEGLRHVLTTLKSDQTTNRLNSIADKISAELKETVTITVSPDLLSFRDVFEKTDSEAKVSRGNYEDEADDRYSEQENRNVDTVKESLEQLSISSVSPESTFVDEDASVLLRDSENKVSLGSYEDKAVGRYSEQENRSDDTITESLEQLSVSSVSPESTFVDEDSSVLLRANLKTSHQKDKEQSMEPIPKEGERHWLYRLQAPRELETDQSGKKFEGKIKLDDNGRLRRVLSLAADEDDGPDNFLFQERSMRYRLFDSDRVQRHFKPVIGVTEERESREAMSKFAQGSFKASSSEKQFDRTLETVEKYFQEMVTNTSNVTEEKLKGFVACIKYLFHLQNDETEVETKSLAFLPDIYQNQQRQRIENKRSRLERLRKDFTIFKRGLMMKVVSEDELYIANRQAYLKTTLQKDKEQSVEPALQDFERHRHYRFQALWELGTDQSEDDFEDEIEPGEYDRSRSVLSPTNDEVDDSDKFLFQRLSSGYQQSESVIEMTEDRESHETMSKFALGLLKTSLSVKDFDKSLEIAEKYFQETVKHASSVTEEELKAFNGQIEDLFQLQNDETQVETEISGFFSYFYPNQQRKRIENKRSRLERLRKDFTILKRGLKMKIVSEDELYITKQQENFKTSPQKDKEQSMKQTPKDIERHRFQAFRKLGTEQSEDDFDDEMEPDDYDRLRSILSLKSDEEEDCDKILSPRLSTRNRRSEPVIEMTKDRKPQEKRSNFELRFFKTSPSGNDFDKSFETAEKYFQEMVKNASTVTEKELIAFKARIEDLFHLPNDETQVETESFAFLPYIYQKLQQQRIENKRSRLERLRKDFTTFKQKLMMKVVSEDELYIQEKQELRDYLIRIYKNKFAEGVYRRQSVVRRFPQLHTQTRGCNLTCSDVFFEKCRKCKNICVIGEEELATSFCLNLVSDWCDEKSSGEGWQKYMCHECEGKLSVKEFEFVLMISLYDAGKEVFIPNMVKRYLLRGKYKNIFEKVIERESEKCLILLDGLSHWSAKNWSHLKMLERNLMDDYVVITTASIWGEIEITDQVFYLM